MSSRYVGLELEIELQAQSVLHKVWTSGKCCILRH